MNRRKYFCLLPSTDKSELWLKNRVNHKLAVYFQEAFIILDHFIQILQNIDLFWILIYHFDHVISIDFLSDSDFDFFRFEKATSLWAAVSFTASFLSASEFKAFFFGTAPCLTVPAPCLTVPALFSNEPASLINFNLAVIFFSGDADLYFRTCSRITGVKARIANSSGWRKKRIMRKKES